MKKVDDKTADAIAKDIADLDAGKSKKQPIPKQEMSKEPCPDCNGTGLLDPFNGCKRCNRTGYVAVLK